jgi:lysozyme
MGAKAPDASSNEDSMIPRVIDISHHNTVGDLHLVAAANIWGVIHKATEGDHYVDPTYAARRKLAHDAGLFWGAYHFNTGAETSAQVDYFLENAKPDPDTLLVLDFEDNRQSNMSIQQAVEFLYLVEEQIGRKAAIYSGNRLKENMASLNKADRDYVTSHRLWLCQYGPTPKLPPGFAKWWLWQFTDGVINKGHSVPGVAGEVDQNTYLGTKAELESEWA